LEGRPAVEPIVGAGATAAAPVQRRASGIGEPEVQAIVSGIGRATGKRLRDLPVGLSL
jgi:hypothetical protein